MSLSTARAVTGALNFEEYEVYPIFITTDGNGAVESLEKPVSAIEELQFGDNTTILENNITDFLLDKMAMR